MLIEKNTSSSSSSSTISISYTLMLKFQFIKIHKQFDCLHILRPLEPWHNTCSHLTNLYYICKSEVGYLIKIKQFLHLSLHNLLQLDCVLYITQLSTYISFTSPQNHKLPVKLHGIFTFIPCTVFKMGNNLNHCECSQTLKSGGGTFFVLHETSESKL